MEALRFMLSYGGNTSDESEIDLYDIGQALVGFQRSLALTTHLILNGEIITQSPSLEGAKIVTFPAEAGSFRITAAIIVASGIYTVGTAPKDTPIGNLISSAYDYLISETLGFHVDYAKTLGQQYEETHPPEPIVPQLQQYRLDSLIEKCENAVKEMHRPIVKSRTATSAAIQSQVGAVLHRFPVELTAASYEYIAHTERQEMPLEVRGWVSSYNVNTFKGRIFTRDEGRPAPFELSEESRDDASVNLVTNSLMLNAQRRGASEGEIAIVAYRNVARSGRLKSFYVLEVKN